MKSFYIFINLEKQYIKYYLKNYDSYKKLKHFRTYDDLSLKIELKT
jgi:hypothetical protein